MYIPLHRKATDVIIHGVIHKQEFTVKTCSSCKEVKEASDFQKRKASTDGLTASCKECLKLRDRKRYEKEKDYRAERHRSYMQTKNGKEAHASASARWNERNKLRRAAHVILSNAVRDGRVQKLPCWICGNEQVEGHHPDYDSPLDVVWLCTVHHKEIHLKHQR